MLRSNTSEDGREGFGMDSEVEEVRRKKAACEHCHRLKMKCTNRDNPPCDRCRQANIPCVSRDHRRPQSSQTDARLQCLEQQSQSLQRAVNEVLTLQRAVADGAPRAAYSQPHTTTTPGSHYSRTRDIVTPETLELRSTSSPRLQPNSGIDSNLGRTFGIEMDEEKDSHAIYHLSSMCHEAEAARLKNGSYPAQYTPEETDSDPSVHGQSSTKKRKIGRSQWRGDGLQEDGYSTARGPFSDIQPPDPIEEGICSEATARNLYNRFMDHCLVYMPCFDPDFDTFDSMRQRSSFCFTTMIMIGAKVEEAAGSVSDLQRRCREHAERIATTTLFSSSTTIETVQAMLLLASWGDTSWRPGGHAARIAMDLRIHLCLPLLVQSGMGKGKSGRDLRAEWPLVEGARTWLTLFKLEHEMSFNLSRPLMIGSKESIKYARELLKHPLAVERDARLVASCELMSHQVELHNPFELDIASAIPVMSLETELERYEQLAEAWYIYWDQYLSERGVHGRDFLREGLKTMRFGSQLNIYSRLLHGVCDKHQVQNDPRLKLWATISSRAAATIVSMALRGGQYASNLRYANMYTHLNVAFAAQCLLRLSKLVPETADAEQVANDVRSVANLLATISGYQYDVQLRRHVARTDRPHSRSADKAGQDRTNVSPLDSTALGGAMVPMEPLSYGPSSFPPMMPPDGTIHHGLTHFNPAKSSPFTFADEQLWNPPLPFGLPTNLAGSEQSVNAEDWLNFPYSGTLPLHGGTDDLADILSLLTQSTQDASTMY